MPQEVFTADVELTVSILEAGSSDGRGPFPTLTSAGPIVTRTFETVVLENDWISLALAPDLGGRLLNLVDKRSGVDVLGGGLTFAETGPRGVHAFGGIEVTLDGEPRMNALGTVRTTSDEEGVWIAEAVAGGGLSYHLHVSLQEATVRYVLSVRNRTLGPIPWNPGLIWSPNGDVFSLGVATACYQGDRDCGFAVTGEGTLLTNHRAGRWTYFQEPKLLAPRWGESFTFTITPLVGADPPVAASSFAVLRLTNDELSLNPSRSIPGGKLVLQTSSGQTLEAPTDLLPDAPLTYKLDELGGAPTGFALLDSDRVELLRYPPREVSTPSFPESHKYGEAPGNLASLDVEPATRYWGAHLRCREAFRNGQFDKAEQFAEQALLYNGEDPLAWIEKVIAARLAGIETADAPDLPNAHFLAPLEPLLKAESFLSQVGLDGKTFLGSFAATPNDLIEVACCYVDLGLFEDAARFIDAATTVAGMPMLRYLYAYCCIATGKLMTDAATAVASVTKFETPYPWRPIEAHALRALVAAFPNNEVLKRYLDASDTLNHAIERDLAR